MNIWIFHHYAITPDMPGGTRHYDLSRELVKRGHKVTIFAKSFHHYLHKEMRLGPGEKWKLEEVDGIRFVWIRTPPYWKNDWRRVRNMAVFGARAWWLGLRLPKIVPEVEKPDVIIGSSPHLLTPLAAYKVAQHYGVKFIMEVRDLWPQIFVDMGVLSAHHPVTKGLQALERFLYRRAERIIILGHQMRGYISNRGVSEEKIVWIPNGVDLSRFASTACPGVSREDLQVMYLGAHSPTNSLDVLIHAAKIIEEQGFRGIRFVLIGDGPEKPQLMALSEELGLNNVEFRDPVPKTKVPKVLREADILVITKESTFFSYGGSILKLFDYMAAKKPVILSGKPLHDPIEEAGCGLTVPPRDPKALAEAIIQLYQMPEEEREAMGRRGWEYVERHHDIRKLGERLEGVLEEAVGCSKTRVEAYAREGER